MRVVWTKQQVSSREVYAVLSAKMGWKPATVKTLLRRLVAKGALTTTKTGRAYTYQAAIPEQATMNAVADELFGAMCQMHRGQTIAHLVAESPLSQGDIHELIAILKQRAQTAPAQVPCDCLPDASCTCKSTG